MITSIPVLLLSDPERIWMNEVYNRNLAGQDFTVRNIWSVLHDQVPSTFRPPAMDPRLISAGGTSIRLLGIVALQGNDTILSKANQVIGWIRQQLLKAPDTDVVTIENIVQGTGLGKGEVHLIIQTVQEFGQFYRITKFRDNTRFIDSLEIGGNDDVYYQYIQFPGIEELIRFKSYDQYRRPIETFTPEEMQTANEKLDVLLAEIQTLKMGHEVIWTDIRKDIEELKALYSLGKKNWRQLLLGKIAEMVAAGVVSDTLSKTVEEMFKPVITTYLPF